jgi:hypothetical protein
VNIFVTEPIRNSMSAGDGLAGFDVRDPDAGLVDDPIAFDDRDGGARRVDRLELGPRERVELGELRGRRLGGRHREGRDNRRRCRCAIRDPRLVISCVADCIECERS